MHRALLSALRLDADAGMFRGILLADENVKIVNISFPNCVSLRIPPSSSRHLRQFVVRSLGLDMICKMRISTYTWIRLDGANMLKKILLS